MCGHSYGGMVITDAGADDRVTQLLYVTSVMPDAGQSQAELIGSEPAPWPHARQSRSGCPFPRRAVAAAGVTAIRLLQQRTSSRRATASAAKESSAWLWSTSARVIGSVA